MSKNHHQHYCTKESKSEETHLKYALSTSNNLENSLEINVLHRLQMSHCSSASSESDLSMSLSIDRELDILTNRISDIDELPAFDVRLISPMGRTPSPIDNDLGNIECNTPTEQSKMSEHMTSSSQNNSADYVTLHDINAQISPPSDVAESSFNRTNSLETIYEGVYLNTPPRKRQSIHERRRSRFNQLEKATLNRLHAGKENYSPTQRKTPSKTTERCEESNQLEESTR